MKAPVPIFLHCTEKHSLAILLFCVTQKLNPVQDSNDTTKVLSNEALITVHSALQISEKEGTTVVMSTWRSQWAQTESCSSDQKTQQCVLTLILHVHPG